MLYAAFKQTLPKKHLPFGIYTLSPELKDSMAFDILKPAYTGLITTPNQYF